MAPSTIFQSPDSRSSTQLDAPTSLSHGEFALIQEFKAPFASLGAGVVLGPGDDCAILEKNSQTDLCVTVDGAVDGVHFSLSEFLDEEIGHKVLAMNLSDLAAMGAIPRWFVCSVEAPNDPQVLKRLPNIARAMAKLSGEFDAVLVGGNFTHASNLAFHITAAGDVPKGEAMRRSGARMGDLVCVSGYLGGASVALNALLQGEGTLCASLRRRQCQPLPRIALGQALRPLVTAALDISDGFLQDVGHICETSHVGIDIDAAKIPIDPLIQSGVSPIPPSRDDQLWAALTGGEDYELAFTIPPQKLPLALEEACTLHIPITPVGIVVPGNAPRLINCPKSLRLRMENTPVGFDHFCSPQPSAFKAT